ncbi:hypothetical protein VPH35_073058 [Triticum aestivum]
MRPTPHAPAALPFSTLLPLLLLSSPAAALFSPRLKLLLLSSLQPSYCLLMFFYPPTAALLLHNLNLNFLLRPTSCAPATPSCYPSADALNLLRLSLFLLLFSEFSFI